MVFMETSANVDKEKNKRWKVCHRCKTRNPKDANYCMKCWNELHIKHESEIVWDNRL
jgi:ribosomal protein L40E